MAAPAPPAPPAPPALTETQRSSLLQWLHARGLQQKATTFELLARRVQAIVSGQADPAPGCRAPRRLARAFIADAGIVCARPLPRPRISNVDESDGTDID